MPIYEYQCDDCEHKFERLQKMNDAPLQDCPDCGEQSLRKLVSAAAFRLSGSGWYETDFKDKKEQKNLSKSDSKPKSTGDSKKSDSSDSKKSDSASSDKGSSKKTTETKNSAKAASSD